MYRNVNAIVIIKLLHINNFFFTLRFFHLFFKNISYTFDSFNIVLLYFLSYIFHMCIYNSSISKIIITPGTPRLQFIAKNIGVELSDKNVALGGEALVEFGRKHQGVVGMDIGEEGVVKIFLLQLGKHLPYPF